jgi:6-phosphogluconolactonase
MARRVEICEDESAVAEATASLIAVIAPRTIALSGGSSVRPMYTLLGSRGTLSSCDIWQVDERCVPPGHKDSNARIIRETIGLPFHRMLGEDPPDEAARVYDEELRASLGDEPVFDLVVLGMGPDGHVASLFPDAPELDERERRVVATAGAHQGHRRITLTLPVLNRARNAVFMVMGVSKAAAFQQIQDGELLPAGRVLGATWILDREAATPPQPAPRKRRSWEPIEGQESLF